MSECWTCDVEPEPQREPLAGMRERAREAATEASRLLRVAAEMVVLLAIIALPWLFRATTVAAAVWAVAQAYPRLAAGLGGDPPAGLLALAVVLLPPAGALGLTQRAGAEPWGAFLAAAAATYLLGQVAEAASPLAVSLAVGATFTGVVIYVVHRATAEEGENDRSHP